MTCHRDCFCFIMQLIISIPHITDWLEKVPAKLIMFPTSISIIIVS